MTHPRTPLRRPLLAVSVAVLVAWSVLAARASGDATTTTGQPIVKGGTAGPGAGGGDPIARGKFLTQVLGCVECHTPRGRDGKPDMKYYMAGHRAADPAPRWDDALEKSGVGMLVSSTGTAYAGPWGVTYARNLTPDPTTGIGKWNDEAFIYVLREGTLKPPMPNLLYGNLSDDDLKSIFAYLQSVPPVKNLVPFRALAAPRLPDEKK
ncbi:MAG: c-type cytochrome [Candidatus Eisenbacteria bacterium]